MIQYHKISVSKRRIDVTKTNASKECLFCHYWFFEDTGFIFDDYICHKCYDLLTKADSLKNVTILNAKGNTNRCILMGISKNEGWKRLNNSVTYDRGVL